MQEIEIRKQHYVWSQYLSKWAIDDYIYCLDENKKKVFPKKPEKIGYEIDFYCLDELNNSEINKIFEIIGFQYCNAELQTHIKHWTILPNFFKIKNWLEQANLITSEINTKIKTGIQNSHEIIHRDVELKGSKYITQLLNKDTSFFNEIESAHEFIFFLLIQQTRTKHFKNSLTDSQLQEEFTTPKIDLAKASNLISLIAATKTSYEIRRNYIYYNLILIENYSETPFITSEQPILGLGEVIDKHTVKNLELFYPISPNLAILLTPKMEYHRDQKIIAQLDIIEDYNNRMLKVPNIKIFSNSEKLLLSYTS